MKAFIKRHETVIRYFGYGTIPLILSYVLYAVVIELGTSSHSDISNTYIVALAKTVSWFITSVVSYFINIWFVFRKRPPTARATWTQLVQHTSARIGAYFLALIVTVLTKVILQYFSFKSYLFITPDNLGWLFGSISEVAVNYFIAKIMILKSKR